MINKLEHIHRNFLWEGQGEKGRMHLLKWNEVVKPKGAGGLDLGDLRLKNLALLEKWLWRLAKKKKLYGGGLLSLKYGESEWGWVLSTCLRDLGCGKMFGWGCVRYTLDYLGLCQIRRLQQGIIMFGQLTVCLGEWGLEESFNSWTLWSISHWFLCFLTISS